MGTGHEGNLTMGTHAKLLCMLVTVKTYPTASTKYRETVCVAGLKVGDPAAWVRLFPVPFRTPTFDAKFPKYSIIEADVTRPSNDHRPESWHAIPGTIRTVEILGSQGRGLTQRRNLVEPVLGRVTMCGLQKGVAELKGAAPSLGAVRPLNPIVSVVVPEPWGSDVHHKNAAAAAEDLFGKSMAELQQPPLDMRVRYRCEEPSCHGHDQKVIDWEAGIAALNWMREVHGDRDECTRRIVEKWSGMFDEDRDSYLFVGNQHQYPSTFSIIGTWYPRREEPRLF